MWKFPHTKSKKKNNQRWLPFLIFIFRQNVGQQTIAGLAGENCNVVSLNNRE